MKEERRLGAAPVISGRKVSGMASVFNSPSHVLFDQKKGRFVEIILPGAITDMTLQESDIKALIGHNRERLLARSNRGIGTLKLSVDTTGLHYEFDAPETADGSFVCEMLRRGDISGSSFAFSVERDEWKQKNGIQYRYIHKISRLYDVSVVVDPAYPQADASVRQRNSSPDYRKSLHAKAKAAGIPFTAKEKIAELKKECQLDTVTGSPAYLRKKHGL